VNPSRQRKNPILEEIEDILTSGVVNLVVLASFSLCFEGDD